MTGISDHLGDLDDAVDTDLCDDMPYRPVVGPERTVRARLLRPADIERLEGTEIVLNKPTIRVSRRQITSLSSGDIFVTEGRQWRVAGAPRRPGNGRRWYVEVEDKGAA